MLYTYIYIYIYRFIYTHVYTFTFAVCKRKMSSPGASCDAPGPSADGVRRFEAQRDEVPTFPWQSKGFG